MELDIEDFLEEIKKFPELFEKKNKFYLDSKRKERIWQNLSELFSIDAKKKWNYLRDKFVREKKKLDQPSGSSALYLSQWEYFPMMEFLNDSLKPRKMVENSERPMETSSEDDLTKMTLVEEDDELLFEEETINPKKTKKSTTNFLQQEFSETLKQFQNKLKSQTNLQNDEDGFFLQSIACSMKQMTIEAKHDFKIEMLVKAQGAARYN